MKKMTLRNLKHATEATDAVVNPNPNTDIVAKDALLLQDRSRNRASFQGRFRKTAFGDFKGRPGRAEELSEAKQDDYVFSLDKEEAALAAAAVTEAAAADGVVIEDIDDTNLMNDIREFPSNA